MKPLTLVRLLEAVSFEQTVAAINSRHDNILNRILEHIPGAELIDPAMMRIDNYSGDRNQCERNAFQYVKRRVDRPLYRDFDAFKADYANYGAFKRWKDEDYRREMDERNHEWMNQFKIVFGYLFEHESLIQHWWVYDTKENQHIEVTPLGGDSAGGYIGVVCREDNAIMRDVTHWGYYPPYRTTQPIFHLSRLPQ